MFYTLKPYDTDMPLKDGYIYNDIKNMHIKKETERRKHFL